jgi:hypothetical protein
MNAILMRLRSELRARWRAWVGLALLLGLAGGAATAAAVGARRTDTAYPRLVAANKGFDLLTGGAPESIDVGKALVTLAHLPEVKEWARVDTVAYAGYLPDGNYLTIPQLAGISDSQNRYGFSFNRWKVLSGRRFDVKTPDEAMVDFGTADKYHLRLGSVVRLARGEDFMEPNPKLLPVRIVGIVAAPGGFPAVGISSFFTTMYLTPAFVRTNHITPFPADSSLLIRLRRGAADLPAFLRDKDRVGLGDMDVPIVERVQTAGVQRSIRFESQALWALAALIGLAALAVLGQSLARQMYLDSSEFPVLRAVGISRRQLIALGLTRAGIVGVIAAFIAAPVAIALSPLSPIGLARLAEPKPGIWVDGLALALGSALVLVLTIGAAILPAMSAARSAATSGDLALERARPSLLAAAIGRVSSSPSAAAGLRMALEPGSGRTAVPVRSAIFGATISIAALTAALMFGTSLSRVLGNPRYSGYTWDAFVAEEENSQAVENALRVDPHVAGFARGGFINVKVGGESLFAVVQSGPGPESLPVISEGRAPTGADEVALGVGTMRASHTSIGDTIGVTLDDPEAPPPITMKIVGQVIVPPAPFGVSRPGEGAALSVAAWSRLDPAVPGQIQGAPFLVRFAPGVSQEAGLAAVRKADPTGFIVPADRPGDVSSLARIANIPVALAGLLALLALGTLAHTLVTSIRRRRRDLAILKTMGFVRGQVGSAVAWQASTLAAIALVIGLPVGVAAGRWGWAAFADQVGVLSVPVIPTVAVLIAVPVTLILANLIALPPGRSAARTAAAQILRSE